MRIKLTRGVAESAGRVAPAGRVSRPSGFARPAPLISTSSIQGFDTLSTEFTLSLSKGYELLNRRSLALA